MGKKGTQNKRKMVRFTPEQKEEIVKLAKVGFTLRRIAEIFKVSHPAIFYVLKVEESKKRKKHD